MVGSPLGMVIGEEDQAGNRALVGVVNAVVIGIDTLGKVGLAAALYFNMNQHPGFLTVFEPDLHQPIGQPPPQFCIANNLPQFGIQKNRLSAPVNAIGGFG